MSTHSAVITPYTPASRDLRAPLFADYVIVLLTLVLLGFGLVMVYSTTGVVAHERFGDSLYFAKRQCAAALIGLGAFFVASRFSLRFLRAASPWAYLITLALLLLPIIPGLGDSAGGASRWVNLAGVRFQPGELAKLSFVLFIAGYFARHEQHLRSFVQGILMPLVLLCPVAVLFLLKPDFGSAAVVTAVTITMAMLSGVRLLHVSFCGAGLVLAAAALVIVSPYRMSRIVSFLSPWSDPQGKGYQLIQSLIAVGSGELTGVGIGGSQQKLFFLPASHTDFIFAVIGEELGFLGAMAVVALFIVFMWRGFKIAYACASDTFAFALASGLTLLVVVPAMLNVGVTIGLLPTKGMVLPLIAYGGSSLITCLATVGLLLAVGRAHVKGETS